MFVGSEAREGFLKSPANRNAPTPLVHLSSLLPASAPRAASTRIRSPCAASIEGTDLVGQLQLAAAATSVRSSPQRALPPLGKCSPSFHSSKPSVVYTSPSTATRQSLPSLPSYRASSLSVYEQRSRERRWRYRYRSSIPVASGGLPRS